MEASESSKVTVEYHDPSGVFPLVSRDLAHRLPLRNLNWQSPSRPLRQIKTLHVDFIPDKHTSSSLRPPAHRVDSTGPNSVDIVRGGEDPRRQAFKERRHQIPGLKTSPYLKVYLLRCDDKDAYKSTERQKLREWIRDNAPAEGKREKHDAFEWLVIHVVIPDTIASSEPRWRETKDDDELKERPKSSAKWPGKSTRTVFDKLRADFNESSKTGPDRIAQLRLTKDQVPPDLLPTPAVAPTLEETLPERENAWADLVAKLKNLILIPFDLRVRQYEEDIAEQDARRALPGWNFCTFFIHKEGLAKALESVGMVEDALALYDELSAGLESVLRDQAAGKADGSATSFSPHTDDIEERILGAKSTSGDVAPAERSSRDHGLGLFAKDYRERIVMSQISVFDFFCYLFVRQKALLLRLANAQVIRQDLGGNSNEDLMLIAEVTQRSLAFIHSNARILRADLASGYDDSSTLPTSKPFVDSIYRSQDTFTQQEAQISTDCLVSSWCHAVAGLVLDETTTSAPTLAEANRASALAKLTGGSNQSGFGFIQGADVYPQRFSSLNNKRPPSRATELRSPPAGPDDMFSPPSSSGGESDRGSKVVLPGMVQLAVHRAELLVLRRKMLELLASRSGWVAGWAGQRKSRLEENNDANVKTAPPDDDETRKAPPRDRLPPYLAPSLDSESSFLDTYAKLSDSAIRHYQLASHFKSAEAIQGDLAVLKIQQGDYAAAATYFQQALPTYAADGWSLAEAEALSMHAKCLKELRERNDYVRTVLVLLGRIAKRRMENLCAGKRLAGGAKPELLDAKGYLPDLLEYSKSLPYEITSSLGDFFADLHVDCTVRHLGDRDGFKLALSFRHVLDDDFEVDQVSLRLARVEDAKDELWLHRDGPVTVMNGVVELELESSASTFGAFLVDSVILKARKLRFERKFQPPEQPDGAALGISYEEPKTAPPTQARSVVLLYPDTGAFEAEVALAKSIHIDKPRHLHITLRSGRNDISSIELRLKPTSAGLRLHLGDATTQHVDKATSTGKRGKPGMLGQISLGALSPNSNGTVTLPYTIETNGQPISLRLEATYHTPAGSFTFTLAKKLSSELPLDVDVNDIFHHDALFSNFTVRPMHSTPVRIVGIRLKDSAMYAVETPPCTAHPVMVSEAHPARLAYKLTRKAGSASTSKRDAALELIVDYVAIDDLVADAVLRSFGMALSGSHLAGLERLLMPVLRERCGRHLTPAESQMAMLTNEAKVPSHEEVGWPEILDTLPDNLKFGAETWLRQWHQEHPKLNLNSTEHSTQACKRITLTVDVPTVDFVNTATLRLLDIEDKQPTGSTITTLGQPLSAELTVRSTTAWNGPSKAKSPQSFTLDIQPSDPDSWLISGPRRSRFTYISEDDEPHITSLTLVPLKLGELALPNLEIAPVTATEGPEGSGVEAEGPSCETDYRSAGRVVTVVRDERTRRVWVPDIAGDGGGERESGERDTNRRSRSRAGVAG
ncbi:hypothetical protein MBLNU230_g7065t1 [Neophaeotheca triangularis]